MNFVCALAKNKKYKLEKIKYAFDSIEVTAYFLMHLCKKYITGVNLKITIICLSQNVICVPFKILKLMLLF